MKNLIEKIGLIKGDITHMDLDAIVNPTNKDLRYNTYTVSVDGCVYMAGGIRLRRACQKLNGCETGDAKITKGYNLPCKYIIHTVGPVYKRGLGNKTSKQLASCYKRSLEVLMENGLRTIAFPAISTGEFGYPIEKATKIACDAVIDVLKNNMENIDKVRFVCFTKNDYEVYKKILRKKFNLDR